MQVKHPTLGFITLILSLALSACAPGQLLGPTITPSPTITPTPTITPSPTITVTPSPSPTFTPTDTLVPSATPTPSGPANVNASFPAQIAAEPWGDGGWIYNYTVTFTETNGVSANIDWMKRTFIDRSGGEWSSDGSGFNPTLAIPAGGQNTYSSWVRGTVNPDLRGGTVEIYYSGHDTNGIEFSGSVTAVLSMP